MEEEEEGEVDVEMDETGEQEDHHFEDEVIFMENGWNGRRGPMPSNQWNL